MSDTPRMDATLGKGADWVFAEGCRLERELAACKENLRVAVALAEDLIALPSATAPLGAYKSDNRRVTVIFETEDKAVAYLARIIPAASTSAGKGEG